MADRSWHGPHTQGIKHVHLPFRVAAAETPSDPPTFVEGDKPGASVGSYVVCTKVATGKYRFKTVDKYLGLVSADARLSFATPDGTFECQVKTPVQNTDKTWQFEVWVFELDTGEYALADLAEADEIHVDLVVRDSQVKP